MADIAIFRVNYKSDFIITLESDAGWTTPFCIKFWTDSPARNYFAGWDGKEFINCKVDDTDASKLIVLFDDHHLPVGQLKMQMAWHSTIADFPHARFDEVMNQMDVVTTVEGGERHVELALNGETAPEIAFSLPAYAAEAQRIANEEARIANEEQRIENEQRRIEAEAMRETRFASMEQEVETAITDANTAARNAKADYIGEDSYVYHWSIDEQRYIKTDIYVRGKDGKSAYEQAQEGGYEGTEEDFMEMLAKCAEYGGILIGADSIKTFEELNVQNIPAGTFCMYQGKLYRFTIEHEANTEWNPAQVYETNLFKEIDNMIKSDYEEVIITLQTEDGVPLAGVEVVVKVEGEDSGRNLITDNEGKCSTQVGKGLEYTVECANVPNYYPVDTVVRRASLPVRYINFTYVEDDTLTRETVKITLSYADSTLPKATWVRVYYDGENHQLAVVDNVAETSIKIGTQYMLSFEDIDGYKTPAPLTYTASLHGTRNISIRYNAPVAGINWLMRDGSEREINDVTNQERLDGKIWGLIVQTSELQAMETTYVIPIEYLLNQENGTGQWLSANVAIPSMDYYSPEAAALSDFDGEANCRKIREFIVEQAELGHNYSSSMVTNCYNRVGGAPLFKPTESYIAGQYVIYQSNLHQFLVDHPAGAWVEGETSSQKGFLMPNGFVQRGFQESYAQAKAYINNYSQIDGFTYNVFGIHSFNFSNKNVWTSTQAYAQNGVWLNNGRFYNGINYFKNSYFALLPVFAY